MLLFSLRRLAPALFVVAVAGAQAQQAPRDTRTADPLDANAAVPAVTYQSVLSGSRRDGDEKPLGWKEANDKVGRIGGWRAYAREAAAATAASPASPAPVAAPPAAAHGAHKH
ncbi:hypothetical protein [Piscinibacter sakaiensis]|uniref:hypothetical protein n=1 Tax=Piscinibacter sakaiensis TaxID=1547922 RepID=UPI003AAFB3D1